MTTSSVTAVRSTALHAGQMASQARHYADMDRIARAMGASPHQLVAILYDELLLTISVALKAAARGNITLFEDRRGQAIVLLTALERGLDLRSGSDVATGLSDAYRAMSNVLASADAATAETRLRGILDAVRDLAEAWAHIGAKG